MLINKSPQPARLDTDKLAKPLTQIVGYIASPRGPLRHGPYCLLPIKYKDIIELEFRNSWEPLPDKIWQ
jgi:hypothetical protein